MTKKRKQKPRNPKPIRTPGPATDRRVANKPFKPARVRTFVERSAMDDPGPEDLTHFDAAAEIPDFFDSRAIMMDDE